MKVNYKPNGVWDTDTLVLDPDKEWDSGNIVSSDLNSETIVIKYNKIALPIIEV